MTVEVPHPFSDDDAVARLHLLADLLHRKYGLRFDFTETRATAAGEVKGVKVQVEVLIQPGKVVVTSNDPPLLLRAVAKAYVSSKLTHYLDPHRSLADLQAEE